VRTDRDSFVGDEPQNPGREEVVHIMRLTPRASSDPEHPTLERDGSQPGASGTTAEPEPEAPTLVGATWCAVRTSDPEPGDSGCDVGLGAALLHWHRLAWVAVVGGETLGTGLSWSLNPRRRSGPLIAVAAGVVVPYDSSGIDARKAAPALGATLAFGGKR